MRLTWASWHEVLYTHLLSGTIVVQKEAIVEVKAVTVGVLHLSHRASEICYKSG